MKTILMIAALLFAESAAATEITIAPYLQSATTDSIWVLWETDTGNESVVEWGSTNALGNSTAGATQTGDGSSVVHEVQITELAPGTPYYYRTVTDDAVSSIEHFRTPPDHQDESSFSIVAISDMQQDSSNPNIFEEVIHDGIIDTIAMNWGEDIAAELALVMIPGDLVDNGWVYSQWRDTFFDPAAALMAQVPFYPIAGNHEANSPYYFNLFHLPENGDADNLEHWWWSDYGNLRIIGMDSNWPYADDDQLTWLRTLLDETCLADEIDFVFAQLHHPYKSELWIDGELDFTGEVIALLEEFTEDCGKPSLHFFGHTHGYSRGQSQDHRHLWVNVATAGGNIDYWGEYAQNDYDEFSVSQDEWGFVVVDVEAGEDPSFLLQRFSRGNEVTKRDNELRDQILIRRYGVSPTTPGAVWPEGDEISAECVVLTGSDYIDADSDEHGATHWQIAAACDDFAAALVDEWIQHENQYGGIDQQAGDDLTDHEVTNLAPETSYCWRLRYRDRGLNWSEWSSSQTFATAPSNDGTTEELLLNTGAEDGVTGWSILDGELESLKSGECNGVAPNSGKRYFAIGGICKESAYGWARQSVDVSSYASEIDAGEVWGRWSGWMRSYSGNDNPAMSLSFEGIDSDLGQSDVMSSTDTEWTQYASGQFLPTGTRTVHFDITGTRNSGTDNDSYVDDLSLKLDLSGQLDCQEAPDTEETTSTTDTGGEDATTDTGMTDNAINAEPESESAGCGCRSTKTRLQASWIMFLLPLLGCYRRSI